MIFFENQTIASFTLKMKTFTMVHNKSKCFSQPKATFETIFMRSLYAKFRHFGQKPYFRFFGIAH